MIEIVLVSALKNIAPLYPLLAPQNSSVPFMIYQVVHEEQNKAINGNIIDKNVVFQVDIYSNSYSEIKALKQSVLEQIVILNGSDIISKDDYDEQEQLYMQILQFKIKRI